MVLCRGQGNDGTAGHQGHHAQLLAFKLLLDHDLAPRDAAEFLAHHDAVDGFERFFLRVANDHALARGQAVRLDDDGVFARLDVLPRRLGMIEDAKLCRRHVGVPHQLFENALSCFDLGGGLGRPEDAQPLRLEDIDDAGRERILGADDGQANVLFLGEAQQVVEIVDIDGDIDAVLSAVPALPGAEDLRGRAATRASRPQRVFARLCRG